MTGEENPFYEYYDEILDICREYDVTVSLGDACRPGCLADATDVCQIEELVRLGELTRRAWEKDVQVMVEGPGHMPLDQIEANMKVQQSICQGAQFYVLGPLVTDIAPGYDHITSAIGGAVAASAGAAFLCYVTPAEHLALPNLEDVKQGIMASKIAAHAADIAKGVRGARQADDRMAQARRNLDWEAQWECAMDPETAKRIWNERNCVFPERTDKNRGADNPAGNLTGALSKGYLWQSVRECSKSLPVCKHGTSCRSAGSDTHGKRSHADYSSSQCHAIPDFPLSVALRTNR